MTICDLSTVKIWKLPRLMQLLLNQLQNQKAPCRATVIQVIFGKNSSFSKTSFSGKKINVGRKTQQTAQYKCYGICSYNKINRDLSGKQNRSVLKVKNKAKEIPAKITTKVCNTRVPVCNKYFLVKKFC